MNNERQPILLIPESRRLQDLDSWLQFHGLPSPADGSAAHSNQQQQIRPQDSYEVQLLQEKQKVEDEKRRYQEAVHAVLFRDLEQQQEFERNERMRWINENWSDTFIEIFVSSSSTRAPTQTANSSSSRSILLVPVKPLAETCDTIYTLLRNNSKMMITTTTSECLENCAKSDEMEAKNGENAYHQDFITHFDNSQQNQRHDNNNHHQIQEKQQQQHQQHQQSSQLQPKTKLVSFSLESFPRNAVCEFISVVVGCDVAFNYENTNELDHAQKPVSLAESNSNSNDIRYISASSTGKKRVVTDIAEEYLVDCCRIAHYLQNENVLNEIHTILAQSIDTANCLFLCQVADELDLHVLFERALSHMMRTVGDDSSNSYGEDIDGEQKTDSHSFVTPELRKRIETIQCAIRSSIHNSQQKELYVSSIQEYIAIFAERVQYHKERLEDAKDSLSNNISSQSYHDTLSKIQRQEIRVQTLSMALSEQKKLFLSHAKKLS